MPHHPTPTILAAARALWDRGRTGGKTFDELSEYQKADLIADSEAVINSLRGRSRALDRLLTEVTSGPKFSANEINCDHEPCETSIQTPGRALRASATSPRAAAQSPKGGDQSGQVSRDSARQNVVRLTSAGVSKEVSVSTKRQSPGGQRRASTARARRTRQRNSET